MSLGGTIAKLKKTPSVKTQLARAAMALSAIAGQHELVGSWTVSKDIFPGGRSQVREYRNDYGFPILRFERRCASA